MSLTNWSILFSASSIFSSRKTCHYRPDEQAVGIVAFYGVHGQVEAVDVLIVCGAVFRLEPEINYVLRSHGIRNHFCHRQFRKRRYTADFAGSSPDNFPSPATAGRQWGYGKNFHFPEMRCF